MTFFTANADGLRRNTHSIDEFAVMAFPLPESGKLTKLISFLGIILEIRRCRGRYDIFHVHGGDYTNLLLARLVGAASGLPTVVKLTLQGWDDPGTVCSDRRARWAETMFRKISAVVVLTQGQLAPCRRYRPGAVVEVIPNGVDCRRFRPVSGVEKRRLRIEMGIDPDRPVLLYVGHLSYVKGTDRLLRIFGMVRERIPSACLVCAGDFMRREVSPSVLTQFMKLGEAENSVDILSQIKLYPRDDCIERYFQLADVFVFPSRREGFGTVQIEAMAVGLPCVVADLPGISEDIFPDSGVGVRVPGEDVQRFSDEVCRLLGSPELRRSMGRRARARAVEVFSYDSVAYRYHQLYRRLLEERRPWRG